MPVIVNFWMGSPLSYITTKIETYFNDQAISSATGFILHLATNYFLITNWHVLSGRNPIDNACLSPTAAIPNRIKFHVALSKKRIIKGREHESLFFKPMDVWLFKRNEPIWIDSKGNDNQNDFAAILIDSYVPELKSRGHSLRSIAGGKVTMKRGASPPETGPVPVSDVSHFYPAVGSEVFVLGYPKGISAGGVFPIWKRASIASEPQTSLTLGGKEYPTAFYIDAMTKSGMSGSPVVYLGEKGDRLFSDDGVQVELKDDEPLMVGVYAGRDGVSKDEHELSLGRVWKTEAVERMAFAAIARPLHKRHTS
ncbi:MULTISPECIES: trypsin-like peptidase domain-containing protein [unclassified Mesorhizobium]|uniref:trypsin-like peptidase domain-containing protein n=1 Tax=unclassified Mesorhizobium TaxID=325217 RepID=UPI0013E3EA1C|nr:MULTISPECIES: trypsin-like peptidase domain-containing protein [unclassified Mesorhizobium]